MIDIINIDLHNLMETVGIFINILFLVLYH